MAISLQFASANLHCSTYVMFVSDKFMESGIPLICTSAKASYNSDQWLYISLIALFILKL